MSASAVDGVHVELVRDGQAALAPRMKQNSLWFEQRDAEPRHGLIAGTAMMDLTVDRTLCGLTVMDERRHWEKGSIGWEMKTRAHRLRVLTEGATAIRPEARWDPERELFALVFAECEAPRIVGVGPRAFAAVEGDRLVAVLADLRGF